MPSPKDKEAPGAPERPQHSSLLDSIIVLMGYAIGIGNLWRFPYLVGKHGGAVFLIPYLLFLIFVASPAYLLEMILGQKFQLGAVGTYRALHPAGAGLGYASVTMVGLVLGYYNILLVWTLHYVFDSFQSPLPWAEGANATAPNVTCPAPALNASNATLPNPLDFSPSALYFESVVQQKVPFLDSPHTGDVPGYLLFLMVVLYIILYVSLAGGIHSTGKVAYVTVGAPIVLIVILFFRVIFLPGAGAGIAYYVIPRFGALLHVETWSIALGQILFSLSPGMGTALAMASYNKQTTNVYRINLLVSACNSGFSLFGGFVIFSVVGYLADKYCLPVEEVAKSGPKLAFVVFAEAVTLLPAPQLWAILFFLMLFTLGLDSTYAWMEAINAVLRDICGRLGIPPYNPLLTFFTTVCAFIWGLLFITRGGNYWLDIVDHYCGTCFLLLMVCLEVSFVWYFYGFKQLAVDLEQMTGVQLPKFYLWTWPVIPFITGALFLSMLIKDFVVPYGPAPDGYPWFGLLVGWVSFLIPLGIVLGFFVPSCFRASRGEGGLSRAPGACDCFCLDWVRGLSADLPRDDNA